MTSSVAFEIRLCVGHRKVLLLRFPRPTLFVVSPPQSNRGRPEFAMKIQMPWETQPPPVLTSSCHGTSPEFRVTRGCVCRKPSLAFLHPITNLESSIQRPLRARVGSAPWCPNLHTTLRCRNAGGRLTK
jgi:hypothetical protein